MQDSSRYKRGKSSYLSPAFSACLQQLQISTTMDKIDALLDSSMATSNHSSSSFYADKQDVSYQKFQIQFSPQGNLDGHNVYRQSNYDTPDYKDKQSRRRIKQIIDYTPLHSDITSTGKSQLIRSFGQLEMVKDRYTHCLDTLKPLSHSYNGDVSDYLDDKTDGERQH